jgi:hypothetical protein
MQDIEFSEEFCRFLQGSIPGVDAAELLLLFRGQPDSAFSAEEAVRKLGPGIDLKAAERYLDRFESAGLVARQDGRYRYRAASDLTPHVETLANAFNHRPVTLVRVIFALRDTSIQSFADAFKLRK